MWEHKTINLINPAQDLLDKMNKRMIQEPTIREEDKINLNEVYAALTATSVLRTKKTRNLLTNFAKLLATKSSFSHLVHKTFNRLTNGNTTNNS